MKKLAKSIRKIGLVANTEKPASRKVVIEAARLISRTGRKVFCDAATANLAGLKTGILPDAATLVAEVDLLLVFGGDGTMLCVARDIAGASTPILGINVGNLGFLTAVSSRGMAEALQHVWKGEFTLDPRALIELHGNYNGHEICERALNDFVISRGIDSRLITLEVIVDGELLTQYRCDGLIVSSPTGSTAYSLSAGGAVVHPRAQVFELTPICPHSISSQSVIIGMDSVIEVKAVSLRPETILSADGRRVCGMAAGDAAIIRRSRHSVHLMRLAGTSFFGTLRHKLHWSGTNVRNER